MYLKKNIYLVLICLLVFSFESAAQKKKTRLFFKFDSLKNDIEYLREIYSSATDTSEEHRTNIITAISEIKTADRKDVFEVGQFLIYKGYALNPDLDNFFTVVALGRGSYTFLIDFFTIIRNMAIEYKKPQIQKFMSTIRNVLENHTLYSYRNRKFIFQPANYTLAYYPKPDTPDSLAIKSMKVSRRYQSIPIEYEGPIIQIGTTNYKYFNAFDTLEFYQTRGLYFINQKIYRANKSTFYWKRLGFDSTKVFTQLNDLRFETLYEKLTAAEAKHTHQDLLEDSVLGSFSYQGGNSKNPLQPRFYSSDYTQIQFNPQVKYSGSFSLWGNTVSNQTVEPADRLAALTYARDDTVLFQTQSQNVLEIIDSTLRIKDSALSIYQYESDSLYHPNIDFKYNLRDTLLTARKSKSHYRYHPFYSSFHEVNILTDYLEWQVQSDSLELTMLNARDKIPLRVESINYFDAIRYSSLRKGFDFHPLQMVAHHARKNKTLEFSLEDLIAGIRANYEKQTRRNRKRNLYPVNDADWLNQVIPHLNVSTLKGALRSLQENSYVIYDELSDEIQLTPRGKFFYLAHVRSQKWARQKWIRGFDYDNLFLTSRTDSVKNATLYLKDSLLHIQAVDRLYISDSLVITVVPHERGINIKEGRDMNFSGVIYTQRFILDGKNLFLEYDSYNINIPEVISMNFLIKDSADVTRKVANSITQDGGGYLQITQPNNKSGLKSLVAYPQLSLQKGGRIDFENKKILNSLYENRMDFKLDDFVIDSLAVRDMKKLEIDGMFKSDGIFMDMEEKAKIMSDLSMGFEDKQIKRYDIYLPRILLDTLAVRDTTETKEPTDSLKVEKLKKFELPEYKSTEGAKGQYIGELKLDLQGIQGKGEVRYLRNSFVSKKFTFLPDSLVGVGDTLNMKNQVTDGIGYPKVTSSHYIMDWHVRKDSMLLTSKGENFKVFSDDYEFQGKLILTPVGLYGTGTMIAERAKNISPEFKFDQESYVSKDSKYFIYNKATDEKPSILSLHTEVEHNTKTKNVNVLAASTQQLNFLIRRLGYGTSLDRMRWNEDSNHVAMELHKIDSLSLPICRSLNPKDPITFRLEKMTYSMETNRIHAEGVSELIVANAKIVPDKGELNIDSNRQVEDLENAVLVLNRDNQYHTLTNANLQILSYKKFTGNADYQYINNVADTFNIPVSSFKIKERTKTTKGLLASLKGNKTKNERSPFIIAAKAKIDTTAHFELIHGFEYAGKVEFTDEESTLFFKGKTRPKLEREEDSWFKYENQDSEEEKIAVYLVVDENLKEAESGGKHQTGLFISDKFKDLYSSFIQYDRERTSDYNLFPISGFVTFDKNRNEYHISSAREDGNQGITMRFTRKEQKAYFEGKLELVPNTENDYEFVMAGRGSKEKDTTYFEFKGLVYLGINQLGATQKRIAKVFSQDEEETIESIAMNTELMNGLRHIVYSDQFNEILESEETGEGLYLGNFFRKGVILDNITLQWSDEHKAFHNNGKAKVYGLFGTDYNTETLTVLIESPKMDNLRTLNMFIIDEPTSEWLYIQITKGKVFMHSSSDVLDQALVNKKVKTVNLAKSEDIRGFVDSFYSDYLPEANAPLYQIPEVESKKDQKGKKKKKVVEEESEEIETEEDTADGF